MVKVKTDEARVSEAKVKALEEQVAVLNKKLENEERLRETSQKIAGINLSSEVQKIRRKAKPSSSNIIIQETIDHKNITLWTRDGGAIGPMHPDNAIQTLNRFADMGVVLLADRPTQEEIAAYQKTDEFKKNTEIELAKRARKDRTRKAGQMEKLTAEIAKLSGIAIDRVNKILPPQEVGTRR